MPNFTIHITNSSFEGRDEGTNYSRAEDALSAGVRSGMAIVSDEIAAGHSAAVAEVCIEAADGSRVLRSIVTLSVSSLLCETPV